MKLIQKKCFHKTYLQPIFFVSFLVLLAGIYCYKQMQTNLFPEVIFPRITVIADAGQQPIDRMMITVTKPLESAVKKVPGVTIVKSYTGRGSSDIDVYFKWGTDIYALKNQIESRINEIKGFLPQSTIITTEAMNQSLYPVYGFTLESKSHSNIELRDVGNLIIRPVFSRVNGISNVVVHGGKSKEFVVIPDASKMTILHITPSKIINALNGTNFVLENGNIAAYDRIYLSLTDTRINTIDDLANTIISNDRIRKIKLSDVAKIEVQEQQEFLKINADGNDAVLVDLVKQPGINLLDFAKDVEVKAKEAQSLLPKGYELKTYYNQSAFVGDSIHSVMRTIFEGLFLAIIVIILFLRTWRASLVVILTIPVTLSLSILLIYLAGITINIMSLGAIAASVGLIIDDAIVIIEQIYREHEENPEIDKYDAVKQAISNLFPAMIASSLSTIVIHFPFRLMSGLAGSFFKELSDTMQLTMVASFFVTWLFLPVLHLIIGYKKRLRPHDIQNATNNVKLLETNAIKKVSWLTWLYNKPLTAVLLIIILISTGFLASTRMETGFLPDLDEGTIVLDYHSPSGTDIEETDHICRQMEKIIMSNKDVETYSRRTALGMSFITAPCNYGDYLIQLKKNRKHSTPEVINQLRKDISSKVPAMKIEFGQRISDLLGDLMSTPQPIEVKIFGNDYKKLQQCATEVEQLMEKVPGIVDIDNGLVAAGSSLVYTPDVDRLSQFGITLYDFHEQLSAYTGGVTLCQNENVLEPLPSQAAMTGGLQIGSVQDGEQMRRIVMRFTSYYDNSPEKLINQPIFLPDGSTRPLSFFCQVKVIPGEIQQRRENLKSIITLTSRIENRNLGGTVKDTKQQFNNNLHLPKGYSISFGGAYQEQQQSFHELMMILCLAILLVMCVLMFLFHKWLISFAILFISISGICGSLIALWITGVPLNVSSYTGIIMIVGIIAENAIFTVHQYYMNRKSGGNIIESVNYAIALRIRPKLMTALSSILALLPLALGSGTGSQMQQPLAVAVIGGLCMAMPLLLIVLPCFMMIIFNYKTNKFNK